METTLAAQYLRVSTERQEYSLSFQSARIAAYALKYNFIVCETYTDEAKSGIGIKHRKGLSQLLRDVLAHKHPYRAILVYDVSRWGRFQDPDEAAAYEFLCKTVGVRVHYCAEPFRNDGYLPNVILKTLKRVMAGEYSRELSEKVFEGASRVARDGFRAGGYPGYGLRRLLISANKTPKGELAPGERKNLGNERVRLIPGPANEIHWVREIYRMFISENRTMQGIADELNRLRVDSYGSQRNSD
jgi:DNA invertase Pin-like site-specific DNA recombinase